MVTEIKYNTDLFFVHVYYSPGTWYIWVYILEINKTKAKDYSCSISIQTRKNDCLEVNINKSFPLKLDLSREEVIQSGQGLVFTDAIAQRYVQNERLEYTIHLSKV